MKLHLTPRELGAAIGVSNSSLKRWVDSGQIQAPRTAGGHRRIPIAEAIRFIRDSGLEVVQPESLGLVHVAMGDEPTSIQSTLYDMFVEGKSSEARSCIISQYLAGSSFAHLCDQIIRPVLQHVGDLWEHKEEGIQIEHQAVDICVQTINQLRMMVPERTKAPIAVGGAAPGDPYILPSLMAATTLAFEGWTEVNLGPNTPYRVIRMAAQRAGAKLAWLSVSIFENDEALKGIDAFARDLSEDGIQLVIGGRGLPRHLPGAEYMHRAESMAELAAFSNGVKSSSRKAGANNGVSQNEQ